MLLQLVCPSLACIHPLLHPPSRDGVAFWRRGQELHGDGGSAGGLDLGRHQQLSGLFFSLFSLVATVGRVSDLKRQLLLLYASSCIVPFLLFLSFTRPLLFLSWIMDIKYMAVE
ncbi:hypothetical protein V8C26DRAFT_409879 [Trichoderma gracile]